jgi:hypothetical protein
MHWWRRKPEQDLERELSADLDLEAAEQQENGCPIVEPRYAAQRAFGNVALIKQDTHATVRRKQWRHHNRRFISPPCSGGGVANCNLNNLQNPP